MDEGCLIIIFVLVVILGASFSIGAATGLGLVGGFAILLCGGLLCVIILSIIPSVLEEKERQRWRKEKQRELDEEQRKLDEEQRKLDEEQRKLDEEQRQREEEERQHEEAHKRYVENGIKTLAGFLNSDGDLLLDSSFWMSRDWQIFGRRYPFSRTYKWCERDFGTVLQGAAHASKPIIIMPGIQYDEICKVKQREKTEVKSNAKANIKSSSGAAARAALRRIEGAQKAGWLMIEDVSLSIREDTYFDGYLLKKFSQAKNKNIIFVTEDIDLRIRTLALAPEVKVFDMNDFWAYLGESAKEETVLSNQYRD